MELHNTKYEASYQIWNSMMTYGHRWIPCTKASEAELWCFLLYASELAAEQTMETPVIWNAIALIVSLL